MFQWEQATSTDYVEVHKKVLHNTGRAGIVSEFQKWSGWIPNGIWYQGEELKTVQGKTPVRLPGINHNMWLDAKMQRRKVIDAAIEVAAYLYKNDNLRINQ